MRLHDLTFGTPEGPAHIELHREMTVLSGLAPDERSDFANSLFSALTGGKGEAEIRYLAQDGSRRRLASTGETVEHHRIGHPEEPLPTLVGKVFRDRTHLRELSLIGGEAFTRHSSDDAEPTELVEARARLAELEDELAAAHEARKAIRAQEVEVGRLQRLADTAEDRRDRAAWRAVADRVEQLEIERGLHADGDRVERDDALVGAAEEISRLTEQWSTARSRLAELDTDAESELDPEEVAHLLSLPESVPADLDAKLEEYSRLKAELARCRDDLRRLAAKELPEPSDPVVCDLARHDQDELWATHARVVETRRSVADVRHRLAGVNGHDHESAVALMEEAHRRLVRAEDLADRHLVPGVIVSTVFAMASMVVVAGSALLALLLFTIAVAIAVVLVGKPRLDARTAALAEAAAANRTGAPSYLGFHLRRLEASLDRDLRGRLEACELEQRLAEQNWIELTGGIDADLIASFEHEARAYAEAIARLGAHESALLDAAATVEAAAQELDRNHAELLALCDEYGIDDPPVDDAPVLQRLFVHQVERRKLALCEAERLEVMTEVTELDAALAGHILEHGMGPAVDAASVATLGRAVEQARFRVEARLEARPAEVIENELAEARRLAADMHRPEWDTEPEEVDALLDDDEIEAAIRAATDGLAELRSRAEQISRLDERVAAMHRRVFTLDASLGSGRRSQDEHVLADVEATLQAIFTAAGSLGPDRERLPLVFDDAFLDAAPSRKWDLLEMVLRMAQHNQVIYLTEDPYVTAWARAAAQERRVVLLAASDSVDADDSHSVNRVDVSA